MKHIKNLKCIIALFTLGWLFLILGLIVHFIIPVIIHKQINVMLPLKNGTLIYQQWQNTTVPAYLQFWFFDVLNPAEILNGDKPVVHQIGPYTYREYRIKYNIEFHDNGTVSYLQKRVFQFDREKSVGDENDTFTTANIPIVVVGDKLKTFPDAVKELVAVVIKFFDKYQLFMKISVKDLTWGYVDPMLEKLNYFVEKFGIKVESHIGLFYGKNNTNDSIYTVDSGNVNLDNFLLINRWNGSNSLSMWNDKYANLINGTDGSMFGPFLNRSSRLYIFQSDICRSIYATYVGGGDIKGIPSINFEAPDSVFANHTVNPDNFGFCLGGYCLGAGVLNLSRCVSGDAPVVMSQPHFYAADQKYIDSIIGISPSSQFKTVLKLEPTTGLPLQLEKKLQINLAIEPIEGYLKMDNLKSVILPMMWLNESAIISDDLASTLKSQLVIPVLAGNWGSLAAMLIGVLLIVSVSIVFFTKMYLKNPGYLVVNSNTET